MEIFHEKGEILLIFLIENIAWKFLFSNTFLYEYAPGLKPNLACTIPNNKNSVFMLQSLWFFMKTLEFSDFVLVFKYY